MKRRGFFRYSIYCRKKAKKLLAKQKIGDIINYNNGHQYVKCDLQMGEFGMPKVINITDTHVFIGMDDGSFEEYHLSDLNFLPHIGDEVEIFRSDLRTIVAKAGSGIVTQNTSASADTSDSYTQSQSYQKYIQSQGDSGTSRSVNKVMYCMLAVLLGGIGAHKFFAGKIGWGVCYILFCWTGIPAIIATIEFIAALFITPDANGEIYV